MERGNPIESHQKKRTREKWKKRTETKKKPQIYIKIYVYFNGNLRLKQHNRTQHLTQFQKFWTTFFVLLLISHSLLCCYLKFDLCSDTMCLRTGQFVCLSVYSHLLGMCVRVFVHVRTLVSVCVRIANTLSPVAVRVCTVQLLLFRKTIPIHNNKNWMIIEQSCSCVHLYATHACLCERACSFDRMLVPVWVFRRIHKFWFDCCSNPVLMTFFLVPTLRSNAIESDRFRLDSIRIPSRAKKNDVLFFEFMICTWGKERINWIWIWIQNKPLNLQG